MQDSFLLTMEFTVNGEPELTQITRQYDNLAEANADIFEFVKTFGEPDAGLQSITIVLISNRK